MVVLYENLYVLTSFLFLENEWYFYIRNPIIVLHCPYSLYKSHIDGYILMSDSSSHLFSSEPDKKHCHRGGEHREGPAQWDWVSASRTSAIGEFTVNVIWIKCL